MGNSSSSLPSSLPDLALHCLRVAEDSPAAGHVEPFFDYLIGVETPDHPFDLNEDGNDGRNVTGNGALGQGMIGLGPAALGRILEDNEGKRVGLRVYNAKSQRIRDVHLVPSRKWSEAALAAQSLVAPGQPAPKPSLLGLSLRACNPAHALESVYHVLDVLEGSPAEMAGLVPWGDFVLAWSGGPLHSEGDFYSLIEAHVDKPLRLFVYNSDLDNLREVVLYPTRQWGGEGLIGCGIGYGLLHRIPRPVSPSSQPQPPINRNSRPSGDGYFGRQTPSSPRSPDIKRTDSLGATQMAAAAVSPF